MKNAKSNEKKLIQIFKNIIELVNYLIHRLLNFNKKH